jgi:hypothetical protein
MGYPHDYLTRMCSQDLMNRRASSVLDGKTRPIFCSLLSSLQGKVRSISPDEQASWARFHRDRETQIQRQASRPVPRPDETRLFV